MALTKTQKAKILDDLKEKIAKQKAMIFVDFTGLKVKALSRLRKELKKGQNELKVVKKTLLNLALKDKKVNLAQEKLKGEVALVFGFKDGVSPAKTVYQFSKENPALKILGGFLEGKFKELEEIIALAQIPTRNELLSRLVNVLEANLKGLVYLLSIIKQK